MAPEFIDWQRHKDRLAQEISALTGRELVLAGDFDFSLLPRPHVRAEGLTLSSIEGAKVPYSLKAEALELDLRVLPLLRGSIEVGQLSLRGADIVLETLDDGRRTWVGSSRAENDAGAKILDRLSLSDVRFIDGSIRIVDPTRDETLWLEDARLSAESLDGPWRVDGQGAWRQIPIALKLSLSPLGNEGSHRIGLELDFLQLNSVWRFSGRGNGQEFSGRLEGEGKNLAALLSRLRDALPHLPTISAEAFKVVGNVTWRDRIEAIEEIRLSLGKASYQASYITEDGKGSLQISGKRLDLDTLLGSTSDGENAPPFRFPAGFDSEIVVDLDTVIYRGGTVRALMLKGHLMGGTFQLDEGRANLPGGARLTLEGQIAPARDGMKFSGNANFSTDSFRDTLAWLGADLTTVPTERLRRATLAGDVEVENGILTVPGFRGRIDLSEIEGAFALALRDRPGLGLKLKLDQFDVPNYFPALFPETTVDVGSDSSQDGLAPNWSALGDFLKEADANFHLEVGDLDLGLERVTGLVLDGALKDSKIQLNEASALGLFGSEAAYQGWLDFSSPLPSFDGHIAFVVDAPEEFSRALGLDWEPLTQLPGYTLFSGVHGDLNELRLSGAFQESAGEVSFGGTWKPAGGDLDLTFDVSYATGRELMDRFGLASMRMPSELELPSQLTGKLKKEPGRWSINDLEGEIFGVPVAGRLSLEEPLVIEGGDRTQEKPEWEADIEVGEIPLGWVLSLALDSDGSSKKRALGEFDGTWSRRTFGKIGFLPPYAGHLALTAKALTWDGGALHDAALTASLSPGGLKIERLTGGLGDGTVILSGEVQGKPRHAFRFTVSALDISPEAIFGEAGAFGVPRGGLAVNFRLSGAGDSPDKLIKSLEGGGEINGEIGFSGWHKGALQQSIYQDLGVVIARLNGVEGALERVEEAFRSNGGELTGRFDIKQGLINLENLRYSSNTLFLRGDGVVDLPRWKIDAHLGLIDSIKPESVFLGLDWAGKLTAPDVRLHGQSLDSSQQ